VRVCDQAKGHVYGVFPPTISYVSSKADVVFKTSGSSSFMSVKSQYTTTPLRNGKGSFFMMIQADDQARWPLL
jgi:hypothetical protein